LPLTGPPDVGLVGFGYYTPAILDLCAEAGTSVAFAVDDSEGAAGDPFGGAHALRSRGVPILSTADFVAQVRRTPELTLVAGRVECTHGTPVADDPFARATAWARAVTDGLPPLVHPVALLDHVPPLRCPDRYAVFGFPGSGNVLTQTLAAAVFRDQPMPPAWAARAAVAESYFISTVARAHAVLAPLAPTAIDFYTYHFGRARVNVARDGGRLGIAREVPCLRHHANWNYVTHVSPTREAVDFLAAGGLHRMVAVVRHPCETLLSLANKMARPARTMLAHPRFLERVPQQLAEWTAHLLANRDRVRVVRYEDLAARNVGALKALAGWLGESVSDADAEALFDKYLNLNLPSSVPTHFFRGGSDKWRTAFEPGDLRRVMEWVPAEAFTAFGYDVPTEADLTPSTSPTASVMELQARDALVLKTHPDQPVPGANGIRVTSTDPDTTAAMATAFGDPEFQAILAAGRWTPPDAGWKG
jgi:hypothetical protein